MAPRADRAEQLSPAGTSGTVMLLEAGLRVLPKETSSPEEGRGPQTKRSGKESLKARTLKSVTAFLIGSGKAPPLEQGTIGPSTRLEDRPIRVILVVGVVIFLLVRII